LAAGTSLAHLASLIRTLSTPGGALPITVLF
jgi:hypothetical protein